MNKIQTLKGFRDFLPFDAMQRDWLKTQMIKVAKTWGYEPLETPTLEPLELFTGQIGEDEKLFFAFEDNGGRKVALRYDQTVPTCRVIGEYSQTLAFPFRRYQVQQAYRAEKPQKGRYREFTQFDLDIFGVKSPLADAEIIAVTLDIYRQLGFKQVKVLVNNRDLMLDIPYTAIAAIDKLNKIGTEGVIETMVKKGIELSQANEYLNQVKNLKPDDIIIRIFDYLKKSGFPEDWFAFEPTLARSFSYSQGPIWEVVIPEYGSGSVGGGERYDGLVEKISGQQISGTGIGIGFDRTLEAAMECNLVPKIQTSTQVMVTIFSVDSWERMIMLSTQIRSLGINCELYPDPEIRLDKQLKYADRKTIPFVIIQGPEEVVKNTVQLKNMATKEQKEIKTEELVSYLK